MIAAAGLHENLIASCNAYLTTALTTAAGVVLLLPRTSAPATLPVRYVDVQYPPLGTVQFFPRTMHGQKGMLAQWLFNCNCCEDVSRRTDGSGQASKFSLAALVDTVRAVLLPTQRIAICDYRISNAPQVGVMRIESNTVNVVTERSPVGVAITNVSATALYLEHFTTS